MAVSARFAEGRVAPQALPLWIPAFAGMTGWGRE